MATFTGIRIDEKPKELLQATDRVEHHRSGLAFIGRPKIGENIAFAASAYLFNSRIYVLLCKVGDEAVNRKSVYAP